MLLPNLKSKASALLCLLSVVASVGAASQSHAAPVNGVEPIRMVIRQDFGGALQKRQGQIEALRGTTGRIEIRGECDSACTLYLGLPQTCVSPTASLGFHGPASQIYGVGLPPKEFQHWSKVMASYYPPKMRSWYMTTARQVTTGMYTISGKEAIRMGARACT